MKIFHIYDIENLFKLIDNCAGPVLYTPESGDAVDLRNNTLVRELLAETCRSHGIEELSVTLENQSDVNAFINYLLFRKSPAMDGKPNCA